MELTATISLISAIIELIIAAWIYIKFPKTKISIFFFILISFVGTYQLSEYMVCSNYNPQLWGRLGFISYTFTATVMLYFSSLFAKRKKYNNWILLPAILMSLYALLTKKFIINAYCIGGLSFLTNKILYNGYNFIPTALYDVYFALYITLSVIFLYRAEKKTNSIHKKYIYRIISISIFSALTLSIVISIFFPIAAPMQPSILNRLGTFFVLSAIASIYLEKQYREINQTKNPE
jgi:hypothetical protein